MKKTIWQICSSRETLPDQYDHARDTWERLNPDWKIDLVTNEESRLLFENDFPEYLGTFDKLPMGVMKADLWRYAVLFLHGGVYADVDTECIEPIRSWFPADGSLHIAYEGGTRYMCQWAFGTPPGHEALMRVMELIKMRVDGGIDLQRDECVHYYTGPGAFTDGVLQHLELSKTGDSAGEAGVVFHADGFFHSGPVRHGFASFEWKGGSYISWRTELEHRMEHQKRDRVEHFKRLVVPHATPDLRRFGPAGDGGFVLSSMALRDSSFVISLGDDPQFDHAMVELGKKVKILSTDETSGEALGNALDLVDPYHATIKVDVEGKEYDLLDAVIDQLSVVPQIAIEFHCILDGSNESWLSKIGLLEKLLSSHFVAHLHGNNYGGMTHGVPDVLEFLLVRKSDFEPYSMRSIFSCPRSGVDFPNNQACEDLEFQWWLTG